MPQKAVAKNMEDTHHIYTALAKGNEMMSHSALRRRHGSASADHLLTAIPVEYADRYLANIFACHAWRDTQIEHIHAGRRAEPSLTPHQQRFTAREQHAVLREITSKFGAILFTWEELFDEDFHDEQLPTWPATASALAYSPFGIWASTDWSLVDTSSTVSLFK
jgi:hypothetical protein